MLAASSLASLLLVAIQFDAELRDVLIVNRCCPFEPRRARAPQCCDALCTLCLFCRRTLIEIKQAVAGGAAECVFWPRDVAIIAVRILLIIVEKMKIYIASASARCP